MTQKIDLFALEVRRYLKEITGIHYVYLIDRISPVAHKVCFRGKNDAPTLDAHVPITADLKIELPKSKDFFTEYLRKNKPEYLKEQYRARPVKPEIAFAEWCLRNVYFDGRAFHLPGLPYAKMTEIYKYYLNLKK